MPISSGRTAITTSSAGPIGLPIARLIQRTAGDESKTGFCAATG
jgi:hypothetical protein